VGVHSTAIDKEMVKLAMVKSVPTVMQGCKRKANRHLQENVQPNKVQTKVLSTETKVMPPNCCIPRSGLEDLSDCSRDLADISRDLSDTSRDDCTPRKDHFVHVSQSGLLDIRQKLMQGRDIRRGDMRKILHRRQSITVPLDIRAAGSPFLDLPSPTDLEDVCEKLGAHDMAEGLVKALDFVVD